MTGRPRAKTLFSLALAYALTLYAALGAAALGAHAAEAASPFGRAAILCLGSGEGTDGAPGGLLPCSDLCRIAATAAHDAPAPSTIAAPIAWPHRLETDAPSHATTEPAATPSARDPPDEAFATRLTITSHGA